MTSPAVALTKAIVAALKADAAVMAIAQGVHDKVPYGAALPYVAVRAIQVLDDGADCIEGYEINLGLDAWSEKPGLTEAAELAGAVTAVLHEAELALVGYRLVDLQHRSTDLGREPDGVLSRARMEFRALVDAAWTPDSLFASGEVGAWYDPSDLATVWQDSARTTPGAVDQPVGALDDKSGNGNHLVQATAGLRPILRRSGALTYIERDGVDDVLATAAGFTLQAGWTLAAAASFASGVDTSTRGLLTLNSSTTDYFILGFRQSITEARSAMRGANGVPAVALTTATGGTASYPAATAAVLVSRFQALSHDIRVDGTTLDTEVSTWNAQSIAGAALRFGGTAAEPIAANLYAAVALKRIPSAAELASLESWLAEKVGEPI